MTRFILNGRPVESRLAPDTPVLWVIRDELGLLGTKFGCGMALCGACTVHLNGEPTRTCVLPVSAVAGQRITTIEGLSPQGEHPLQKAWVAEQVPQCGYCQSGQLMTASALLAKNGKPTREQIVEHMAGNLCRCGSYNQIIAGIEHVAKGA